MAGDGKDWLTQLDTDGDGLASKEEWLRFGTTHEGSADDSFTEEHFVKLDKDKNGKVTPMEYHTGMQQLAADLMAQGYGGGGAQEDL